MMNLPVYIDPEFQVPLPLQKNETESWGSFFWNTGKENYFYDPKVLMKLARRSLKEMHIVRSVFLPKSKMAIEILAHLVGINPSELIAGTAHHFFPTVAKVNQKAEEIVFWDNTVGILFSAQNDDLRPSDKVHICTDCMRVYPHHKTESYLTLSAMCSEHGTLLIDRCPNCGSAINLFAAVMDECQQCKAKFSLCPVETIDQNAPGALSQNMIYDIAFRKDLGLMSNILKSPRAAYVFIKVLLGWLNNNNLVDFYTPELSYRNSISSNRLYNLLGIIYLVLSNWPNNFLQFLDIHRNLEQNKDLGQFARYINRMFDDLANSMRDYGLPLEHIEPIKQVFIDYCSVRFSRLIYFRETKLFRENEQKFQEKYALDYQAANYTGVRAVYLSRLVSKGKLAKLESYDQPSVTLYTWDEIELLRNWLAEALNLEKLTQILHLSKSAARDLVTIGLLTSIGSPAEGTPWLIDPDSVRNLLAAIQKNYHQIAPDEITNIKLIPFLIGVQRLETIGFNQAKFIQVITSSQDIRLFGETNKFTGFYNAFVSDDEISDFRWEFRLRENLVTREMIAKSMGVKLVVITKWIQSGLLTHAQKHASRLYFDKEKIDRFIQEHIFIEDAVRIFDINVEEIWRWIAKGRLHPVSGPPIDGCQRYLLRRQELDYWTQKQLITAPKLAKLLNISHSQLLQWAKQGKIQPVSGPGVDGYKQYFFEVNSEIQALIDLRSQIL